MVHSYNYATIFDEVRKHYEANGESVPSEQTIIDYLCANLSIPCIEMETRTPLVNKFVLGLPTPAPSCCGKK